MKTARNGPLSSLILLEKVWLRGPEATFTALNGTSNAHLTADDRSPPGSFDCAATASIS